MSSELHVIFGTGPLGKWTARELVTMGKQVRLVNRRGSASDLPEGAEIVKGDAYDPAQVRALVTGATAVYQCAQPEYHQWAKLFPPLQANVLAAAAAAGAKLIVAENLYMYGETGGTPLTEDSPYNAHTRKGRVRRAMTEALFAAHRAGTVRAAAVRGSDFFGPDDHTNTEFLFYAALAGKTANLLGRLDMPHTFTYVADFGRALAIAGTRDDALGRAWHVPSDAPVTQARLVKMVEAEIGKPVKVMAGSAPILTLIGLFSPSAGETVEMLYEFTKPFVMDSSAFQRTFGVKPTPLAEAVRETLAWCRAHPLTAGAGH